MIDAELGSVRLLKDELGARDSGPLSLRPALSLSAFDNLHISGHWWRYAVLKQRPRPPAGGGRGQSARADPNPWPSTGPAGALNELRDERHVIARDGVDHAVGDPVDDFRQKVPPPAQGFGKLPGPWNAHAI